MLNISYERRDVKHLSLKSQKNHIWYNILNGKSQIYDYYAFQGRSAALFVNFHDVEG